MKILTQLAELRRFFFESGSSESYETTQSGREGEGVTGTALSSGMSPTKSNLQQIERTGHGGLATVPLFTLKLVVRSVEK